MIRSNGAKFCVVGAGPCGLTAAKNLKQAGIPFDCFEREDGVGGNWYFGKRSSSVYASTHMISSKRLTEYTDFAMPADYPHYPSHRQVLDYLHSYVDNFGLSDHITFNTSVSRIEPEDGGWSVQTDNGGAARHYDGVIIANGHHWNPLLPQFDGSFNGDIIHSRDYNFPDQLTGRRVLVIGAGNSGCDIAVEAAQNAESACLSIRRGYHFLPKFLFGRPIDECGEILHRMHLPLWLRRWITKAMMRVAVGSPRRYGLPKADHRLFETHPIVNSQLLYFAGHGEIDIKPDVAELCGDSVRFADGSEEPFDLIICATGFQLSFPFLDSSLLLNDAGRPELFLNVFHPRRDNLFVVGLIQPDSGIWGLADLQSQLIARFLIAMHQGSKKAAWFQRVKSNAAQNLGRGIHYVRSPRHAIEVEHFGYRKRLERLIRRFNR